MLSSQSPDTPRLRIAIQKSGRLFEESVELLKKCGVRLRMGGKEKLVVHAENFPLDVLLIRDDDIPQLLLSGASDVGIVGLNIIDEHLLDDEKPASAAQEFRILKRLDFGSCKLVLGVPESSNIETFSDLEGKRVATTYPNITRYYLKAKKIEVSIVPISGSVEIAPRLGMADAVCDIVSTGSTMEANRLRQFEALYHSSAVLVSATGSLLPEKEAILETLQRRIDGVMLASEAKYVMLHVPKEKLNVITKLLPGTEHPTVLPLAGDETKWAVHAVCKEAVFWETMEELRSAGASSILILPIEKMMA